MVIMITLVFLLLLFLILPTVVLTASKKGEQRSSRSLLNSAFNGYEILENNILNKSVLSLIRCSSLCAETSSCLSLNYNEITKTCVLFDKDFTNVTETSTIYCGDSWFYYYVIRDAEMKPGHCSSTFKTDICSLYCLYYVHEPGHNYTFFESFCNDYDGGEMVIVDRQLKQYCVKTLLAGLQTSHSAYIQGKLNETTKRWKYNDGTDMTYFDWKGSQLENRAGEIYLGTMKTEGYLWDDVYDNYNVIHATVCQQT